MNELSYFLEILKYIIAGSAVFFVGWFFVRTHLLENQNARLLDLKKAALPQTLPLRLQAYERVVLFLERINPANMLLRLHVSGISAREMHGLILADIRAEYEHNVTQQLYLSPTAWSTVQKVKEETLSIINAAYRQMPAEASGAELSKTILARLASLETTNPYDVALNIVKHDIQQLF